MCTVLQQHLNQTNGFADMAPSAAPGRASGAGAGAGAAAGSSSAGGTATPSGASTAIYRHVSPNRMQPVPTYSYLQVRKRGQGQAAKKDGFNGPAVIQAE